MYNLKYSEETAFQHSESVSYTHLDVYKRQKLSRVYGKRNASIRYYDSLLKVIVEGTEDGKNDKGGYWRIPATRPVENH